MTEQSLDRVKLALAEALTQRQALTVILADVLSHFGERGHPGRPCIRTGWVTASTFDGWHASLRELGEVDANALFVEPEAEPSHTHCDNPGCVVDWVDAPPAR